MRKSIFALVTASAALASPAMAQDDEGHFGGFYAGAIIGLDSVELSFEGEDGSDEDVLYGVVLGYDLAGSGNVVLGIEGEWSGSKVGSSATDILTAGDEAAISAGRDLYVGVRAGTKVSSNALLYVKGGYTNASVKLRYDDGVDEFRASDRLDGYRIGGGAEISIQPGYAVRLEYRYSDYGEYSYQGFDTGITASRHQGAVTLLGKF